MDTHIINNGVCESLDTLMKFRLTQRDIDKLLEEHISAEKCSCQFPSTHILHLAQLGASQSMCEKVVEHFIKLGWVSAAEDAALLRGTPLSNSEKNEVTSNHVGHLCLVARCE